MGCLSEKKRKEETAYLLRNIDIRTLVVRLTLDGWRICDPARSSLQPDFPLIVSLNIWKRKEQAEEALRTGNWRPYDHLF